MRIVLGYPAGPWEREQIVAAAANSGVGRELEVVLAEQADLPQQLLAADIFCGHVKVPVPWKQIVAAGRLRWIQSSAAGLDHCLVPEVMDSEIVVSSASGVFAEAVAAQTAALLFGLLRRVHEFLPAWQAGEFRRRPTDDLEDKTLGIVGFGGNGTRIAEVLAPWRVTIVATDYFAESSATALRRVLPPTGLPELLAAADVLILTAPLTPQTDQMIGAEQLAQMRPGGYLINVGRGRLVDENALVDALAAGQLAGAGLDVTPDEPPRRGSRLWGAKNLIVTPHVGAQSARRIERTTALFCQNLERYFAGVRLINVVDKWLGFPAPADRWRT